MFKIYLDDERETPKEYLRTYTVQETITLLKIFANNNINCSELSLDNDLGENEPEGYKVADWLEEQVIMNNFPVPDNLVVHSANPVAAKKMQTIFSSIVSKGNRLSNPTFPAQFYNVRIYSGSSEYDFFETEIGPYTSEIEAQLAIDLYKEKNITNDSFQIKPVKVNGRL